jgi:carotenoid cleavage dioxygenase
MYDSDNPFLNGNFAPWREEGDAPDLEIDGSLPRELNGALYRIGPNPHFKPRGRYHWFDGDGMVHSFVLRDGRAAYRNRYVRTAGLTAEMKAGKALYGGLIDSAPPSSDAPVSEAPFKNAANTNIIGYANRLLALWEAGLPHELNPKTLETVGPYNFCGKLNGPMTAHPKFDPKTGELLFFGYQPFPPFVTYYRADTRGNLLESHPIDAKLPVMMHDFVTTENYAVFFVCPSVFRLENMGKGLPVLVWEPNHGTDIGVMPRKGGQVGEKVRWFKTDACYIFHFLNAFEERDTIAVDACRMNSLDMTGSSFGAPPIPHRWTLDLKGGTARLAQTDEQPSEFPRIDDRLAGFKHRYGYFAGSSLERQIGDGFSMLIKRDYQTGGLEKYAPKGRRMMPGEPVFVPRSAAAGEDDGYVLAVWYDPELNRSELIVQAAQNFAGEPVARVKLNHRVPFGFHGNWVPAQS